MKRMQKQLAGLLAPATAAVPIPVCPAALANNAASVVAAASPATSLAVAAPTVAATSLAVPP